MKNLFASFFKAQPSLKNSIARILNSQPKQIAFSFLFVILTGSILLSLPIALQPGAESNYLDHLFTAVSMVCVTGLFTVPVGETYTIFGQIVAMVLMQIGGLSLMTLMSLSIYYLKKNVSLKNQYLVQSTVNRSTNYDLKNFLANMVVFTLVVEVVSAIIIAGQFVPQFGWAKGTFSAIFLSISAFNNAGFDNLGTVSLMPFKSNGVLLMTVSISIIFAGLGFSVWYELKNLLQQYLQNHPRSLRLVYRRLSIHSRVVIIGTFGILFIGTLLSWLIEKDNPGSLGGLTLPEQLVNAFFQTVSMRTAGFATLNYDFTNSSTNLLYIIQMVIGGSPGGTAGGIKVTTFIIILLYLRAEFKGNRYISLFNRSLSNDVFRRAVSVFFFYLMTLLVGWILILITNPTLSPFKVLFESVSALSTVGVTMNLTTTLNRLGQMIIMAMMFIGRVGPLTVFMSLSIRQQENANLQHASVDLLIG